MRALAEDRLSELELAILRKAVQRTGSVELYRQLNLARLRDRQHFGVGLDVGISLEERRAEDARPDLNSPINGLLIQSAVLPNGGSADSLVWLDHEGFLDSIEILGNGGYPDCDYEAIALEDTAG